MKTKLNIMVILTLVLTLFGAGVTPANAATGDLDLTFGTDGRVVTGVIDFGDFNFPLPSVQQSDGSILVGGYVLDPDTVTLRALLERYTANGGLDTSFGTDGRLYPQVEGSTASIIVGTHIGSQDEILAVGGFATESNSSLFLARYNSDGTPLAGFGTNGILPLTLPAGWMGVLPSSSALQSDGMVLISGVADVSDPVSGGTVPIPFLMRVNLTNGTLDTTFGSSGVVLNPDPENYPPYGQITLQSDGRILVTSSLAYYGYYGNLAIYRFTADGAPDTSFGPNGDGVLVFPFSGCSALAEGPGGALYLTVGPSDDDPSDDDNSDFYLARLNADGSQDETFGGGAGYVVTDFDGEYDQSCALLVQADGKVIVGGGATRSDGTPGSALVRYTADGALDESFGSGGKVFTPAESFLTLITELALTPGGELLATGFDPANSEIHTTLLRYDLDGGTENNPPVANPGGPYLAAINTAISFDGSSSSDADGDPLTYAWTFGDGGASTEAAPSHSYAATGVYDVCLTVNDGTVDSDPACTLAVVYDPDGESVKGNGEIDSPAGSYPPDQTVVDNDDKTQFGFKIEYKRDAAVPTGNLRFKLEDDDKGEHGKLEFEADAFEWLVIAGAKAVCQGTGAIKHSEGNYGFMLTIIDAELSEATDVDRFRLKIWDMDNGNTVIYDNEMGEPDGAGPVSPITKGKIEIKAPKGVKTAESSIDESVLIVGDPPAELLARIIGTAETVDTPSIFLPLIAR